MCVRRTAQKERVAINVCVGARFGTWHSVRPFRARPVNRYINVACCNSRDLWRMKDLTLFPSGSSIR
eukprot:5580621-Prymnesium_polylepis.1